MKRPDKIASDKEKETYIDYLENRIIELSTDNRSILRMGYQHQAGQIGHQLMKHSYDITQKSEQNDNIYDLMTKAEGFYKVLTLMQNDTVPKEETEQVIPNNPVEERKFGDKNKKK